MKRSFTNLIAALALLSFLTIPTGMWGQTTYEQLTSIANIDESAQYVLGIDGTGFHYSGTSSWGLTALPSEQTPIYYTLTKGSNNSSFTASATINNTTYYLTVPTSKTFTMSTTSTSIGMNSSGNVVNTSNNSWMLRRNGTNGIRAYSSNTGAVVFFYKVITSSGPTQLTTPTNFQATAGNGQAEFTWNAVSNASSYTISYTSDGSSWQEEPVTDGSTTTKTITSLTNATTYTCKIKANGDGTTYSDSEYSSTITVTPTSTLYTVTLHAGSGTVNSETTFEWNVSMNEGDLPDAVAPCNTWSFGGWSTSAVSTQTTSAPAYVATHYVPTGDIDLYAVYTKTEGGASFDGTTGGNFLIYADVSGTNHYATGAISSSAITSTTTLEDAGTFTFEKLSNGNFTIKYGNSYISAASNSVSISSSNTACEWTISAGSNGGSWHVAIPNSSRGLIYRASTYNVFKNYASVDGSEYFDIEIGGGSTTYYHSTPDCTEHLSAPVVTLEAGNGNITYTWDPVTNAQSYTLEWSTSSTFASDVHEVTSATSGNIIAGLSNGTTYYVRVKAVPAANSSYAESDWSTVVSAAPTAIVVATPEFSVAGIGTGTTGEYVGAAEVTITAPDYSTHYIYYTTDGNDPDDSSEAYDGTPIDVLTTTTIKAIAYDGDSNESEIGSIEVTIVETTPIATVFAATAGDDYYYIDGIVTYKGGNKNLYVEDSNGGILVYKNDNNFGSSVSVGNRIVVKGQRKDAYGQPRFENPTILDNDGQTHDLPLSEIAVSQADNYMFRRVKFTQVLVGATANNLTPIAQGANIVNVYNIPVIANVTEEGYYLKSLTGIVATYNQATQIYVASDNDIIAYTINASSNNTTLGTVSASGYVVTATPATGIGYATPSYVTVVDGGVTCTVTQTGDEFKVVTNGDAAIEIQFASAPIYTISYTTNGIAEAATTEVLQSTGEITELITPTAANIPNGYVFMGWTTSAISGSQNNAPDFVEVGDVINDNTSLIAVFAIENQGVSTETVTLTANSSWSGYANKTFTDDGGNEWTANCSGQNSSGTYYYGLKDDGSSFVHSPNFSGTITGIKIWGKNGSSTTDRTFYIKSTQNGASGDLGTVSVPASTVGEELTATLTGSFTSFYLGASGALQFSKLQVSYNGVSNSYSNYCTSVTPIEDNDLPINNNYELTQDYTISGVNYLDTYIIVPDGITLTVDGVLGNSDPDFLVIKDGGQLITNSAVQATVQKDIEAYTSATGEGNTDGWYLIASPVDNYDTANITFNTADLYAYDEPNNYWRNAKNTESGNQSFNKLVRGQGYLYANSANRTLPFAGTMIASNESITKNLSYEGSGRNKGVNLLGNPFTCNLTAANVKVAGDALSSYYAVEGGKEIISYNIGDDPIKPGRGFIVQAIDNGQTVEFNPSAKRGETASKPSYIRIEAGNSNFMDRAYVQIGNGNTLRKITINENVAHVSVMNEGLDYAAATIEEAQGEMPVNFVTAEDGEYTINVNPENVEMNYLHLIDNITGADVDLLINPSYTFNGSTNDYASRFRLVFSGNSVNEFEAENGDFAFISNGQIILNGVNENATLQMVDMTGRIVSTEQINGNSATLAPTASGVYVLRLINGNDVKTQKIVVR